jgi:glycosyl transferase, family 25
MGSQIYEFKTNSLRVNEAKSARSSGRKRFTLSGRRNFTQWFDRTFVINLPHRRDRLNQITAQLARAGVKFQTGRVEVHAARRVDSAGGFPNIGARGCFISHREILVNAVNLGLKRVLILEDDLELALPVIERTEEIFASLDGQEWGLAYLGHNLNLPHTAVPQFIVTEKTSPGAHFYAVQGQAIPELVAFLDAVLTRQPGDPLGGPMHYDGALSMFRHANPHIITIAATVPLGYQGSSRSDITPRPWDRYPIVRTLSHVLRAMRRLVRR